MADTDAFKLANKMADIYGEGKRRSFHISGGTVNSHKRIRYMLGLAESS